MRRPRLLVVDNFDSFTFTLVDYLTTASADVRVERSDSLTVEAALTGMFDGFVISPGPGTPEDAGVSVALARACIEQKRPLLGVCLGHQAIAVACGGAVGMVPPVHGKVCIVAHDGSGVFAGLPTSIQVTRYHSLALTSEPEPLLVNARSADGLAMGLRHRSAPVHGVQFHPESVASEHGHALLRNFVRIAAAEPA